MLWPRGEMKKQQQVWRWLQPPDRMREQLLPSICHFTPRTYPRPHTHTLQMALGVWVCAGVCNVPVWPGLQAQPDNVSWQMVLSLFTPQMPFFFFSFAPFSFLAAFFRPAVVNISLVEHLWFVLYTYWYCYHNQIPSILLYEHVIDAFSRFVALH